MAYNEVVSLPSTPSPQKQAVLTALIITPEQLPEAPSPWPCFLNTLETLIQEAGWSLQHICFSEEMDTKTRFDVEIHIYWACHQTSMNTYPLKKRDATHNRWHIQFKCQTWLFDHEQEKDQDIEVSGISTKMAAQSLFKTLEQSLWLEERLQLTDQVNGITQILHKAEQHPHSGQDLTAIKNIHLTLARLHIQLQEIDHELMDLSHNSQHAFIPSYFLPGHNALLKNIWGEVRYGIKRFQKLHTLLAAHLSHLKKQEPHMSLYTFLITLIDKLEITAPRRMLWSDAFHQLPDLPCSMLTTREDALTLVLKVLFLHANAEGGLSIDVQRNKNAVLLILSGWSKDIQFPHSNQLDFHDASPHIQRKDLKSYGLHYGIAFSPT
ncbi:hypothetical protein [Magnetococcus sp. PR-3]|uniref:hypothetical protein n=1 Tax=Magnetococcus sp. PR-3 TaxID=3120355 RepID=UPI002FCE5743